MKNQDIPTELDERKLARFLRKIRPNHENGCWEWIASTAKAGYGQFAMSKKSGPVHAHRLMFALVYGRLRPGDRVCHHCDNRRCVRPSHLYRGDARTNMRDAIARGGVGVGENAPGARLSNDDVRSIRTSDEPASLLADRFSVHPQYIRSIKRGTNRCYG